MWFLILTFKKKDFLNDFGKIISCHLVEFHPPLHKWHLLPAQLYSSIIELDAIQETFKQHQGGE